MSQSTRTDPLLLAGKAMTIFMQIAVAIGAVAIFITMPALLFFQDTINAEIVKEIGTAASPLPMGAVLGVLALVLVALGLIYVFFDRLRRIIDTVGEGDPFIPANADRLTLMAWLLLGIQVLGMPIAGIGLMIAKWADKFEHAEVTIDAGLDLTGLLMVVILFILARIFRHGAAMRDDLEGTV